MEVSGGSSSLEVVSPRHAVASFTEVAVLEMILDAHNSLCYLLGSLVNRMGLLEHAGGNNQGIKGSILITKKDVTRKGSMWQPHSDVPPENKDDGDSDNDDDEDDDEDGEEQDEDGEGLEDDASGDEDNNPGDEDAEDGVEANGEGGSDDEDDDEDEDDEDDDDDEDGEDEDDEDEEEEEDVPEPPTKKRK